MNFNVWLNKELNQIKKVSKENFGPHTVYTLSLLKIIETLHSALEQVKTPEAKDALEDAKEIAKGTL